jgi:DNA polymerase III epsilon subunit-like protein
MESKNYIFYDLETNGLDYYTTGIMEITMIDINGNIILNQYIYPYDKRIDCSNIHGIDEEKLISNNALETIDLCILMKRIIRERYGREEISLIAYNNFGYDQIIIENNFKICGIKIPNNWYFIDIYPIIRELYPNIKPNYKLKSIYEFIYGNNNINYHSSKEDTICLYKIYKHIESNKDILNKYKRSLLGSNLIYECQICTLNGYNKNMNLESKNIKSIGDIYKIFKNLNNDETEFKLYLKNIGIYSDYYINNIIKQIKIINHLCI